MTRIGICRALHSYHHFSLWERFFRTLGFDVLLSPATKKDTVSRGAIRAPAEICLPVKIFLGHIDELRDQVDLIFVPRLVCWRLGRDYFFGCPKAIGLPDLTTATFPRLPGMVELTIDERQHQQETAFLLTAKQLGVPLNHARRAYQEACAPALPPKTERTYLRNGLPRSLPEKPPLPGIRIGIIGHPYILFDEFLGVQIINFLQELGVSPVIPFPDEEAILKETQQPWYPNWFYELELLAGARMCVTQHQVQGVILVTTFACGTASVTNETIGTIIGRHRPLPTLTLLIDEHTGETGLKTRLEAFVELVKLKERRR